MLYNKKYYIYYILTIKYYILLISEIWKNKYHKLNIKYHLLNISYSMSNIKIIYYIYIYIKYQMF